ncbi:UNVERIFIED_CONTAM: large subunit ribosomal protein L35 [Acetivibrio alkalicellulosi]
MPKIKTHSSSKKRFSLTGTGKVKRFKAYKSHILTKKSTKRKRNLRKSTIASDANQAIIKVMIPYK